MEHDEVKVDEENDGKKDDKHNGKGTKRKREDDEDHDFLENDKRGPPGSRGSGEAMGRLPLLPWLKLLLIECGLWKRRRVPVARWALYSSSDEAEVVLL